MTCKTSNNLTQNVKIAHCDQTSFKLYLGRLLFPKIYIKLLPNLLTFICLKLWWCNVVSSGSIRMCSKAKLLQSKCLYAWLLCCFIGASSCTLVFFYTFIARRMFTSFLLFACFACPHMHSQFLYYFRKCVHKNKLRHCDTLNFCSLSISLLRRYSLYTLFVALGTNQVEIVYVPPSGGMRTSKKR